MATRKHNLRLVQTDETTTTIDEELHEAQSDFLRTIALLEVIQRAVDDTEHVELWASLGIAIRSFHEAHDRMDRAMIRMAREGVPSQRKELERVARESQRVRA